MNGLDNEILFWQNGFKKWLEYLDYKKKYNRTSQRTMTTTDNKKRNPLKGYLKKKGDVGPSFVLTWKKRW